MNKQKGGYKERQLRKAKRLEAKAEKREKRTAESKEAFMGAGPKWEGVEPLWGTGKWARKRAEKAKAKAKAGSRKEWKRKRNIEGWRPQGYQKGGQKQETKVSMWPESGWSYKIPFGAEPPDAPLSPAWETYPPDASDTSWHEEFKRMFMTRPGAKEGTVRTSEGAFQDELRRYRDFLYKTGEHSEEVQKMKGKGPINKGYVKSDKIGPKYQKGGFLLPPIEEI